MCSTEVNSRLRNIYILQGYVILEINPLSVAALFTPDPFNVQSAITTRASVWAIVFCLAATSLNTGIPTLLQRAIQGQAPATIPTTCT